MFIFAAQSEPKEVRVSHTFGLFVKASDRQEVHETQSISWMPKDLEIRPLRRAPVAGVNLNLEQSLRWAGAVRAHVTMWGPFQIRRELYDMAAAQAKRLNSSAIEYVVIDRGQRVAGASNCIHAVSDLDPTQPLLTTGTAFGNEASVMVLDHFRRYVLPPVERTRWLVDRLSLKPNEIRFATPSTIYGGIVFAAP
jgi:hypothetical protein